MKIKNQLIIFIKVGHVSGYHIDYLELVDYNELAKVHYKQKHIISENSKEIII